METKTADLVDAEVFADAIREVYPDKMMSYNLSPSFNWDTTGMTEDEMRDFPAEIGKLGFVFNFITYGGHQIDGLAGEEFAASLQEDGMLALARLQRKFRLVGSPYATPQTLVGGPRLDAALMGSSGRTATTKAMGKGSTQFQHLVHTEVPPRRLEEWLEEWTTAHDVDMHLSVGLRPHTPGSEILELQVNGPDETLANVVFSVIHDRRGRPILMVRDQNNYRQEMRRKRLMTLMHLFLIHRYKIDAVHFLSPTDDNHKQAEAMQNNGVFGNVTDEVGEIIVAEVSAADVEPLLGEDRSALSAFIAI
jgi:isocitrate lyase